MDDKLHPALLKIGRYLSGNILKTIRIFLAAIFFSGITLIFLDFTGNVSAFFGWMAKAQFLPAVLAFNVGVVIALLILTLILGRVYCSIICPLGVYQDIASWFRGKIRGKARFSYSKQKFILRYSLLGVFIIALIFGISSIVALLAPYSAYGRIAQNCFAPIWDSANNVLAFMAEKADSYSFYEKDIRINIIAFIFSSMTGLIIFILAWLNGRTWCNTICPVGAVLGFVASYSWLRPVINSGKCIKCGLCAKNCKAACIDSQNKTIDYSRCVACMNCLDVCKKGALTYGHPKKSRLSITIKEQQGVDMRRRGLLASLALLAPAAARAGEADGGLAVIIDKRKPNRLTSIAPAGALSLNNLTQHCAACQLCISACPNAVLRPSVNPVKFMQPEVSYEYGYCRPECVKCSEVCPAGAITRITPEMKSSIQIGHAVWIADNCIPLVNGDQCGNCARHCPTEAITMIPSRKNEPASPKVPAINIERCIGCGACENLCPARPLSAIYVEGHEVHRNI